MSKLEWTDVSMFFFFFFFQAEDGIRDYRVTGVQTCALPIWREGNDQANRPVGPGAGIGIGLRRAAQRCERSHADGAQRHALGQRLSFCDACHLVSLNVYVFWLAHSAQRTLFDNGGGG